MKPVSYGLEHRVAEVWLVNAPDADMSATSQSTAAPFPKLQGFEGFAESPRLALCAQLDYIRR